jgi:V/A-type H+-transporting ATPase subunit C
VSPGLSYVVIRSHALISNLLTPEQMRALTEQESLEGFVEQLAKTPYGRISIDTEGDISIALEKVFYQKFIERMISIVDVAPKNIGDFLQSYYYLRFEVVNLKRIIRGKYSGIPDSQILESIIPIKPYRVESYEEIVEEKTLEGVIKRLEGTSYAHLAASLELSEKYDALWPLEISLNHIYAKAVFKSLEGLPQEERSLVRKIIKSEADIENFLVAAKQRSARDKDHIPEEMFPATYEIGLEKLKEAIDAADIRTVIQGLYQPYIEILTPFYEGDVALIRSRLRLYVYNAAMKGRTANDFGFNTVMAYLVFSEMEKDDLVGIAWGKAQRVSSEDILKYLTIPHSQ